jgi:rubrerythrin
MADQTVSEGSIDPNPGTNYVTHCPKCGNIFIMDETFNDRCPVCGYFFTNED